MTEQRRADRVTVFDAGAVRAGSSRVLECSVRNISAGGACLAFVYKETALPREFSLTIEPGSTRRSCRLVWQSAFRAGVQFVTGC